MTDTEIKQALCYYDPINPLNNLEAYAPEDRPPMRRDCYCDCCYSGRDKLAGELLAIRNLFFQPDEVINGNLWEAIASRLERL
jgi:hypothetical protein